jgi:hypothetical protein
MITDEEIDAEVELLRADEFEINHLKLACVLRPWCFEEDLRTEAYNRLMEKKLLMG